MKKISSSNILFVVVCITFIGYTLPAALLGSVWPMMYESLGVSISMQSILSYTQNATWSFAGIIGGFLMRRYKIGPMLLCCLVIVSAALLGFSLSSSFWILFLLMIPLGFFVGTTDLYINCFATNNYKPSQVSWIHSVASFGSMLGPLVISFFLSGGVWQTGYRAIALIELCIAGLLLVIMPLWSKVEQGETESEEQASDVPVATYGEALRRKGVIAFLLCLICHCGIDQTVALWGPSFAVFCRNVTEAAGASMASVYFFGQILGRVLSGILLRRLKSRHLIVGGFGLGVLGFLLMFVFRTEMLLYLAFLLIGIGSGPIFPVIAADIPSLFGKSYTSPILGMQIALSLVNAALPALFGVIAEVSLSAFLWYSSLFTVLGMALALWMYFRTGAIGKKYALQKK